ncbi:hypothetical protein [Pseudoalteromonas sp. T1lg10]|uniref:hypothetical protein n=1 Tax=Pseudoalteromonas sp. T1lg10 TaxID=2077093 RepID=UPI001319EC31|nr:hypothetical protein [Pseudoalteromonas sp. T1lg10]
MNSNLEEIVKIEKATDGLFKKSARIAISQMLARLVPKVLLASALTDKESKVMLLDLANTYQDLRHQAFESGARNSSHPLWASAAVCESWVQAMLVGDKDLCAIEERVFYLINRPYKSKVRKSSAALIARGLAWENFTEYTSPGSWMRFALKEIDEQFSKQCPGMTPSEQDIALILKQAIHYVQFQSDAIQSHLHSMETYSTARKSGLHLNLSSAISDYMNDAPYLEKFST